MILDRELVRRITRGQKREHRFPLVRTRGYGYPKRSGYKVGELYPVQYVKEDSTTRVTAFYVEALSVTRSTVGEMDDAAAVRAGFDSLEDFKKCWPRSWRPNGEMWVVEFKVAQEVPRFLAALAGHAPNSDYTTSAARALDKDEAVDGSTLDRYAEENRKRFADDLEAERERRKRLPVTEQLEDVFAAAKERRVDVSGDLRVIQRRIDAMKRKTDAA